MHRFSNVFCCLVHIYLENLNQFHLLRYDQSYSKCLGEFGDIVNNTGVCLEGHNFSV